MPEQDIFKSALFFFHVSELKSLCDQLNLSNKGRKMELIQRIQIFIETGKIFEKVPIPKNSKAKRKQQYPLEPDTLILFGNYKNDLKTRLFFKEMIGEYFHFTAFGIDWINDRWFNGNPPTYREFAKFWEAEYSRRKKEKPSPKQEWAYINFVQNYLAQNPGAKREAIMQEWEKERRRNLSFVEKFLAERFEKKGKIFRPNKFTYTL